MRSLLSILLIVCLSTGCATIHGPRAIDDVPPGGPTLYDWSRVRELQAPAEITVTTRRSRASTRIFIAADESRVVALNLSSPALPQPSIRLFHAMAAQHPQAFLTVGTTGGLVQDDVRVGREGVFVAGRKVADLEEIVVTIPREDVIEVDGPVVARGSVAGATLGGWLGFAVGVVPGLGGVEAAAAWPLLVGSVVLGAYLGYRWSSHTTDDIVYRAR
jgi:hypothetical protein